MTKGGLKPWAGRTATHVKAEHCYSIDSRRWGRDGALQAGTAGTWQWKDPITNKVTSSIGYVTEASGVTLSYSVRGKPRTQQVAIQRTSCNYGGERLWFSCTACAKRVALLYLREDSGFVCRKCGNVVYASQSEDEIGCAWRQQRRAEAKLGPNWQRPKGMHHATCEKLMGVILDCQERRENALADFMERFKQELQDSPVLQQSRHLGGVILDPVNRSARNIQVPGDGGR